MLRYDRKLLRRGRKGPTIQNGKRRGKGFDRKTGETVMVRLCICNGTVVHTAVHCSESARLCWAVLMSAMSVPVLSDSTTCQLLCDYVLSLFVCAIS